MFRLSETIRNLVLQSVVPTREQLLLCITGKTSLIKALSKSKKMEPKDQLFATLDVTAHAAQFPNKLR